MRIHRAGHPGGAVLFGARSQLIVYHFMFGPDWDEGCKSCSFLADHYEPAVVHLAQRDVTLVTASRAPPAKIEAFRERMDWRFKWVSSLRSDFNRDYQVTFAPEDVTGGKVCYNYAETASPMTEGPGISVFCKDADHHSRAQDRSCSVVLDKPADRSNDVRRRNGGLPAYETVPKLPFIPYFSRAMLRPETPPDRFPERGRPRFCTTTNPPCWTLSIGGR